MKQKWAGQVVRGTTSGAAPQVTGCPKQKQKSGKAKSTAAREKRKGRRGFGLAEHMHKRTNGGLHAMAIKALLMSLKTLQGFAFVMAAPMAEKTTQNR